MEIMKTKFQYILCAIAVAMAFVACVDNDDDIPQSRYESNKLTAAQFLEENDARLGNFVSLLKRTSFFQLLTTYGNYTVFAPNNEAFDKFMKERGYANIDEIPTAVADTLVRNHMIKGSKAYFTTDISEGNLGMNMAKLYINLSVKTDTANNNAIIHYANETARMVEFDDSVSNGVVHIVSSMIPMTSDWLADIIAKDSTVTIFRDALFLTGMADTLRLYLDETYPKWGGDKTSVDSISEQGKIMVPCLSGSLTEVPAHWPEYRYFKYTAFVEPNSVYEAHGIHNLEDLKAYAKTLYDGMYPEDAGLYDNDFKNRKNPLNRFVSYHIIDRVLPYDDIIMNSEFLKGSWWDRDLADPEEFYETMCPGTIMRFCIPNSKNDIYINRKGLKNNARVPGILVERGTNQAPNGMYYYVNDIVEYSPTVRDDVLNCRMRFDATVLSPDFQNCGDYNNQPARGRLDVAEIVAFRLGYVKNWSIMGDDAFIGLHGDGAWWSSYKGNAMNINGIFDVTFKLPPVPSGTYEIRTGYTVGNERGVVQFYLNNVPCDIPADLRDYGGAPYIGWTADVEGNDEDAKNANKAIDKAMRNHGYMKGMDTWRQGGDASNTLRSHTHNLRKILTTTYLDQNQTYYIRARQVLSDRKCYWNFDYLELCPKSVYDSPQGEDQH